MISETMTIKEAASRLKKSETFVREGLARGLLPFGTGFRINEKNKKRTFLISRKLFDDYIGGDTSGESTERATD